MQSRHDTEHIDVRPRRASRLGPGLAIVAVTALALAVVLAVAAPGRRTGEMPAAIASPTATVEPTRTVAGATSTPAATVTASAAAPSAAASVPAMGRTYTSPLGYSVDLPEGWRRSDLLSHSEAVPHGDPESLARDLFTRRSPQDEQAAYAKSANTTGLGPSQSYTAFVQIYKNSEGQSTREYAEDQAHAYGLQVASIEDITFADRGRTSGGKPATRVTWRWPNGQTSFATFVEDDRGRMWMIGFYLAHAEQDVPPGATREDLLKIVGTFSAAWLRE